jgi:N-acylglucosamine 2-epimerase
VELLEKALNILDWSLARGWDEEFGGILFFEDADNSSLRQLEWDMKLWWVPQRGAQRTLWRTADRGGKVLVQFEGSISIPFPISATKEYGELYGYLHRTDGVHTQKSSMWKGPNHLPRC